MKHHSSIVFTAVERNYHVEVSEAVTLTPYKHMPVSATSNGSSTLVIKPTNERVGHPALRAVISLVRLALSECFLLLLAITSKKAVLVAKHMIVPYPRYSPV